MILAIEAHIRLAKIRMRYTRTRASGQSANDSGTRHYTLIAGHVWAAKLTLLPTNLEACAHAVTAKVRPVNVAGAHITKRHPPGRC